MNYDYTFYPLSRENTYFIMALYHYREKILEKIELSRDKLKRASMQQKTPVWYNMATKLIIQEILLQKVINKAHKALEKIKNGDIIFSKVENKTNGFGKSRQFYRDRNNAIKQFAYRLVQNGLTDLRVNKEFKPYFTEFSDLPREMKIHEINNKKEVLNNG